MVDGSGRERERGSCPGLDPGPRGVWGNGMKVKYTVRRWNYFTKAPLNTDNTRTP